MTPKPRWHSAAIQDLEAGHKWYEEREPGLGGDLARELDSVVKQTWGRPLIQKKYQHPQLPAEPWVRKVQLKRFSEYGLIYTVVNDTFWIVAVAHAKRRPGYWIDRLDGLPNL
ncbi:MAG: type II toxin-antitoxin system RelE/ParE family toxin [Nocardioidaceae bacterium]|nr:MAG: type II toxin-antitoxin system RelE/ParE family toxin [Nocardioidaceae bacterium]